MMKLPIRTALFAAVILTGARSHAAITVPGADGSDGVLNITANTVIDLSQAPAANWDANNAANAGKGVYDAAKWAVVFKYSSVNVAAGATLTFKNHASRAPVVWLVSGDVAINGTVDLTGQNAQISPALAEPGPGGFRGGSASFLTGPSASAGFGPGGGNQQADAGRAGSFGTATANSGGAYGNPSLVPLIGGSGGAGDPQFFSDRRGGGGGGGAILIASSGAVNVAGEIKANGGDGKNYGAEETGGGSGGGIRIVCETLEGAGKLTATGGGGWSVGGMGRLRVERVNNANTLVTVPDPSVVPLPANDTALLWPPAGAPEVKIVSVGGEEVPADPRAGFGTLGPDVAIAQTASTVVVIETTNVEQASQVKLRCTPRSGANATEITAAVDSVVSASPLVIRWNATVPVNLGYSAMQVRVVRP